MATVITGGGPEDLRKLQAKLIYGADKKLKAALRKRMRDAGKPIVGQVQRSILDMSSVRGSPPGRVPLREALARTISMQAAITQSGIRLDVLSSGRKMPDGEGNLNRDTNRAGGWQHPVYERHPQRHGGTAWARETGKPGWFETPIAKNNGRLKDACQAAIDELAAYLEH